MILSIARMKLRGLSMYASSDPKFNKDLENALIMVRELRRRSYREKWDPRATRCALKFAMKVDDHFSRGNITSDDEAALEEIAKRNLEILLRSGH